MSFVAIQHQIPDFWRAASIVGLGFLPVAEGNVAVPVGLALGLNPFYAVFLSVLGTASQTLLVRGLAGWLLGLPRVAGWWQRRLDGRVGRLFATGGSLLVILVGIPWLGGVPTAFGAEMARIKLARYACWAISGLVLHASILALLIRAGLRAAGRA